VAAKSKQSDQGYQYGVKTSAPEASPSTGFNSTAQQGDVNHAPNGMVENPVPHKEPISHSIKSSIPSFHGL
jgi:hypothetical protein